MHGFVLTTAATEIALNTGHLVVNPEDFGGQIWLLRLAAHHEPLKTGCRGIGRKQKNPLHWSSKGRTWLDPLFKLESH